MFTDIKPQIAFTVQFTSPENNFHPRGILIGNYFVPGRIRTVAWVKSNELDRHMHSSVCISLYFLKITERSKSLSIGSKPSNVLNLPGM